MEWFKNLHITFKIIIGFIILIIIAIIVGSFNRIDINVDNIKGNWVISDKDKEGRNFLILDGNKKMEYWSIGSQADLIHKGDYVLLDNKLSIKSENKEVLTIDLTGLTNTKILNSNELEIIRTDKSPAEYLKFLTSKKLKKNIDRFKSGSNWTGRVLSNQFIIEIYDDGRFDQFISGDLFKGKYEVDMESGRIDFKYEGSADLYGQMGLNYEIVVYRKNGKYYYTLINYDK